MALGFDTPSKRKNEEIDKANQKSQSGEVMDKVNEIGSLIISDEFQMLPPQKRVEILDTFAHYASIAKNSLL